jgi:hypothetical protein
MSSQPIIGTRPALGNAGKWSAVKAKPGTVRDKGFEIIISNGPRFHQLRHR